MTPLNEDNGDGNGTTGSEDSLLESFTQPQSQSQSQLHSQSHRSHPDPLRDDDDDLTSSLLAPNSSSSTTNTTSASTNNNLLPLPSFLRQESLQAARQAVRRMGNYLAYITLLGMLVLIPTVTYHALLDKHVDVAAFDSAGVMVCGTLILSFRLIYLHLTHWYMPDVQKYVVRILWMVPIYAVQSWLSLRFHNVRIYIDSVRDLYEAYVIASFVYYLMELLGGQDALVNILEQKRGSTLGHHAFPLSLLLEPWELGVEFMLQCKHGVLQYVVL
jgi:hypothetical protein